MVLPGVLVADVFTTSIVLSSDRIRLVSISDFQSRVSNRAEIDVLRGERLRCVH